MSEPRGESILAEFDANGFAIPPRLNPPGNLFGGVTVAQASAGLSALSCPAAHRNAVPVEDLEGETVAALCPDCDRQLPPEWASAEPLPDVLPPFMPDPRLTARIKE